MAEQVEWSKSDEESLLVINFSEPTNRPSLDGPVSLNDAIVFNHGEVEMSAGSGSWTPDGLALNITHVDAASWEAITASISSATLHVIPRLKLFAGATSSNQHHNTDNTGPGAPLQGNLTMRMSFPGRISVRLFVGDVLEATSPEAIEVTLCADDVYVKGAKSTASVGKEGIGARKVPRPFFAMDGVVAMPGDEWIKARAHEGVSGSTESMLQHTWSATKGILEPLQHELCSNIFFGLDTSPPNVLLFLAVLQSVSDSSQRVPYSRGTPRRHEY